MAYPPARVLEANHNILRCWIKMRFDALALVRDLPVSWHRDQGETEEP
jgi:hypothetical protein